MKQYKIFVLNWISISIILCLLLYCVNGLVLTSVASAATNNNIPIGVKSNNQIVAFDTQKTNNIYFVIDNNVPEGLNFINSDFLQKPLKLTITNIKIMSLTGHVWLDVSIKFDTLLQEIIKDSKFVHITLNQSPHFQYSYIDIVIKFMMIFILVLISLGFVYLLISISCRYVLPCIVKLINLLNSQMWKYFYLFAANSIFIVIVLMSIWVTLCGVTFGDDAFFNIMSKYPSDVILNIS